MGTEARDTEDMRKTEVQPSGTKTVREELLSCDPSELATAYAVLFVEDCSTMARTISRVHALRSAISELLSQIASGCGSAPKTNTVPRQGAETHDDAEGVAPGFSDDITGDVAEDAETGTVVSLSPGSWFTTVYRTVPITAPEEGECPFQLETVSFPAGDVDMIPGFVSAYERHGDDLPAWSGVTAHDASGHAVSRFEFYSLDMSPAWRLLSSRFVLPDETGVDRVEALAAVLRALTFFGWGIDEADAEKTRLTDTLAHDYEAVEAGTVETVDADEMFDSLREKYGLGPRKPTRDENGRLVFQDAMNENYDSMMECVRGIYRVLRG